MICPFGISRQTSTCVTQALASFESDKQWQNMHIKTQEKLKAYLFLQSLK
jgi:hypothetical protein